jgi:hypothetical protein
MSKASVGKKSALNARVLDELKNTLLATTGMFLKESLALDALRIDNVEREKHRLEASQEAGSFAHSPGSTGTTLSWDLLLL